MFRPTPLLVLLTLACAGEAPVATSEFTSATFPAETGAREALARRVARALADPAFRTHLRERLDASPYPEGKLQLAQFLDADHGRARRAVIAAGRSPLSDDEASAAGALEIYFPVPAHRAAWSGGDDLLVGTIGGDSENPVAFDLAGRRRALDRDHAPVAPVLAVVPAETDFAASGRGRASAAVACPECEEGSGGSSASSGLYITASRLAQKFESWLKGAPEIEVLVLGQKGATDSLTRYQCAGNFGSGPYYFDQNNLDWSGSAMLMSQAQLDAYSVQHPGEAVRLFFVEDDDTPCEIRANSTDLRRLLTTVDSLVRGLSGGDDAASATGRIFRFLEAGQKLFAVTASLIRTNDDLIGNAVEDVTTTERYPGYNWIIKGDNGTTNGYVRLEMR